MKRSELLFNLISIVTDLAMIFLAGIAAFYLRFQLSELRPILYSLTLASYLKILFLVSPLIIAIFALSGLYNLKGTRRITSELTKIALAISSGLLAVVVLFFFNQTVFPSRLIILLSWALAIVFVSLGRIILRIIQIRSLKRGIGLHRLVIIDGGEAQRKDGIIAELERRPELGYKIVKILKFEHNPNQLFKDDINKLVLELEAIRKIEAVDEILQANPNLPADLNARLVEFCRDYGILFNFVPNIFETARTNIAVETISGIPVIVLKGTPLEGWGKIIKRLLDITVAGVGLIFLSPIFGLVSLAIKLNSKGPVFFHQPRAAGLGEFEFYKFRSMYYEMSEGTVSGDKLREQLEKNNARVGPFVKIKNDPRVTPVGRFLRKTKIDELPSLWHILRGQMSLVGPRVHMVKEVDHFRNEYKKLFVLKPGATGLTQITQASENPEISWEEEIRLDAFYIENWSIWLDLYIIFKTILILLGKKPKVDY
ncbi:MAG TPA: sugar transferase [Patescibacteria group bacterium]|jgi:exopolysaccharide biosynthesis polyprenyl glycosylphosphotransferase|nr:sugar transferase [Patescibacteria group bacterium]